MLSSTAVGHLRSESGRSLLRLFAIEIDFEEDDAWGVEMELEAVESD